MQLSVLCSAWEWSTLNTLELEEDLWWPFMPSKNLSHSSGHYSVHGLIGTCTHRTIEKPWITCAGAAFTCNHFFPELKMSPKQREREFMVWWAEKLHLDLWINIFMITEKVTRMKVCEMTSYEGWGILVPWAESGGTGCFMMLHHLSWCIVTTEGGYQPVVFNGALW